MDARDRRGVVNANQEAVHRMIAAFNANDGEALRECLHRDVSVRRPLPDVGIPSHPSNVGSYHGVDEVIPALSTLIERTGGIQVDVRRLEDAPDGQVLVEFVAGMGPVEDRTTWLGWSLFGFRDGLVVSTETFATEAEARELVARSA